MNDTIELEKKSSETWLCTSNLRWAYPSKDATHAVLQQAWVEQGGGKIEWRNIPLASED